ncbi:MAG: RagB/SusD family nutrient uptake outer membrane protein [Gemmatimonadota bacterium]
MRKRSLKLNAVLCSLLALLTLSSCADLELTDPNAKTTDTFWKSQDDALAGLNAAYRSLQDNGTYGRWLAFAYDLRSDIGFSRSPWGDLANFTKSVLGTYDFEVNRELWQHHYRAIFRANQVIANVANTEMDATLKARVIGEARFMRALLYYNLVNLFGNVPLITEPSQPEDRPAAVPPATAWAQIEQDLKDAAAALPVSYSGADVGRATRGAATALLGKALLQQKKWGEAASQFATVVNSGTYQLLANFGDNFVASRDNNLESIFEVQFAGPQHLSAGTRGQNILKMIGPCGVGFCDGEPSRWYFDQFQKETTITGDVDPRLDATLFYNKAGGMDVYGRPFAERYSRRLGDRFWKKYGEHYKTQQDWDNEINVKVMRLGGILLLYAEALNESGQTTAAYAPIHQVRARARLAALPAGLSQAEMRDRIEHEQLLELGLEMERFLYLSRQGWLTDPAKIAILKTHDPDFEFFAPHRALLPIPQTERDLNPNVPQNPGW